MKSTPINESTKHQINIEVLSAGAGSGKTYTLTQRMVTLLQNGVRPAGIMATTFTKKAAAELQERVRVRLLEAGMNEAANELGEALIGTVHGIGTRLLQRFAFEASRVWHSDRSSIQNTIAGEGLPVQLPGAAVITIGGTNYTRIFINISAVSFSSVK